MDVRARPCLSCHTRTLTENLEQECSVCYMSSRFLRICQAITGRPSVFDFVNCGVGMSEELCL